MCDFPGCSRAFTQSGQLKTHQRLHTGERPFQCSAVGCQMRFTHANRHCPDHPYDVLKRCDDDFLLNSQPEEQSTEILKWLQKYRDDRQHQLQTMSPSPSAPRKTPKRSASSKSNDENKKRVFCQSVVTTPSGSYAQENRDTPRNEMEAMSPSKAARKGLMCAMDMNAGTGSILSSTPVQVALVKSEATSLASVMGSPITTNKPKYCKPKIILWKEPIDDTEDEPLQSSTDELEINQTSAAVQETHVSSSPKKSFNPKKKWLREAWQEDLGAQPLEGYGTTHPLYKNSSQTNTANWQMTSPSANNDSRGPSSETVTNPNQNRPSVLIMSQHF